MHDPPPRETDASALREQINALRREFENAGESAVESRAKLSAARDEIIRLQEQFRALESKSSRTEVEWESLSTRLRSAETSLVLQLEKLEHQETRLADDRKRLDELAARQGDIIRRLDLVERRYSDVDPDTADFTCKVKTVAERTPVITLDKGSDDGIGDADIFEIFDGKEKVGRVQVAFLAEGFCTATEIDQIRPFKAGMTAVRITKR